MPVRTPRRADAPPLVHLSDAFEICGTDDNISLIAKRPVEKMHFIVGVALSSALHPRAESLSPARRAMAASLAERVRSWRTGGESLFGQADDAYRIDMILALALELLDEANSPFATYLASLPSAEDAAPPSLWPYLSASKSYDPAAGSAALAVLRETSIGSQIANDAIELAPLLLSAQDASNANVQPSPSALAEGKAVLEALAAAVPGGATVRRARDCVLRALALVSSRMFAGIGMVPLIDLCNGAIRDGGIACGGAHNATIERTQLAVSNEAPEAAPCVAALTSRRLEAGEHVLLAYGTFTCAEFLYKYGYIGGGDVAKEAVSPHDIASVVPSPLWPALSEAQRTVLHRYGITPKKLGLPVVADLDGIVAAAPADAQAEVAAEGQWNRARRPLASPFRLPAAEAAAGKTTPMMRQVGLIACIKDEKLLAEIAKTGKLGTSHGVSAADIARQVVGWCAAHTQALAGASLAPDVVAHSSQGSISAAHCRMALRVAHGERAALIGWMEALQAKHPEAIDRKPLDEAKELHKSCLKRLKRAVKDAASGGARLTSESAGAVPGPVVQPEDSSTQHAGTETAAELVVDVD